MYELHSHIRPAMQRELAKTRTQRMGAFIFMAGAGAAVLLAATIGALGAKALLWFAGAEYYGP